MSVPYDDLIPALKEMLPARRLGGLGRLVGLIRRLRELRAGPFAWAVILSRFAQGRPGFEEARRWYERLARKRLAARPFQLRFKSAAVVAFFARIFDLAVLPWCKPTDRRPAHPIASWFPDVVLWDSTVMQVSDAAKKVLPGIRGIAAGLKVSLAISLYGLVPLFARMGAATSNDMTLFPPLSRLVRGSLLLFDLGFVAYERLREIGRAGHFYVCRFRVNGNGLIVAARRAPVRVRRLLRKYPDGIPLRDVLPRTKRITRPWDVDILLRPDERRSKLVRARLVIAVGPKCSQRSYLTNLDPTLWAPPAIVELYRLRWQIELVFKELKQHLNLESLPTRDPHAIQVLAWASLLALVLSRMVAQCLCYVRDLIGLQALLRPGLLTRAIRTHFGLLARALTDGSGTKRGLIAAFLDLIAGEARTTNPERDDSLRRLCKLLPAAASA